MILVLKAVATAALAAGVVCVAEAGWIHAKASLAQALIAAAWQRELAGTPNARPWPWADTRPLARLRFSGKPDAEFVVLEGASGRNLAFGPVHDPSSVAPGEPGNSVIEGHRDTHFAALQAVRLGDDIVVQTLRRATLHFRVTEVRVVDSRHARIALAARGPRLTLVTCYPFDGVTPGGPLRWVVTADAAGD